MRIENYNVTFIVNSFFLNQKTSKILTHSDKYFDLIRQMITRRAVHCFISHLCW